ncbi:MAG: response regulator [Planctomycetaceae bacterium]|nr:response regulator [Planctomycetaceae bacterium]
MKILLVDDSGVMRVIQRRCLNKLGIEDSDIDDAADGLIALQKTQTTSYTVIFTDWNMPNMNGLELLIEIRKNDKVTPVIMVTTEAARPRVLEAVQNGVSDYLVKPFTQDDLKDKIMKWVGCHV